MKRRFITAALIVAALGMGVVACSDDDDDNKPGVELPQPHQGSGSGSAETPATPAKVTVTLPDGSTKELDKDAKYTVEAASETEDGFKVKFFVGDKEVSGQEITVSADTRIVKKIIAAVSFSGVFEGVEIEKGGELTLPAPKEADEAYEFQIGEKTYQSGDKITVDDNTEIKVLLYEVCDGAKYLVCSLEDFEKAIFKKAEVVNICFSGLTNADLEGQVFDACSTTISKSSELAKVLDGKKFNTFNLLLIGNSNFDALDNGSFASNESIRSVVIKSGITHIGSYSFMHSSIKSFKCLSDLAVIDYFAFCVSDIESVVLPGSLQSIGRFAFADCDDLNSMTIDKAAGSVEIDEDAFAVSEFQASDITYLKK